MRRGTDRQTDTQTHRHIDGRSQYTIRLSYSSREVYYYCRRKVCGHISFTVSCWSRLSVTRSSKSVKSGSRYLVDSLSEGGEFWATGSPYAIAPSSVLSVCLSVTLVYCGQTVGRIKMKLGMRAGLVPFHTVLDGNPAPLTKRVTAPNFPPISIVTKQLDGSKCHLVRR